MKNSLALSLCLLACGAASFLSVNARAQVSNDSLNAVSKSITADRSRTAAVQTVKGDALPTTPGDYLINALSGQVAGVNITQGRGAGAASNIILRGGTSLTDDNQPLFVVDGIIYDNTLNLSGDTNYGGVTPYNSVYGNRLMDIDPEDVEEITVLKGPAASARYGIRGGHGAIVITTKRGVAKGLQVNVSSEVSTSWAVRLPEMQSLYKRGFYSTGGILNTDTKYSWGARFTDGETVYDNLGNFLQNATTWNNNVSLSGGNERGNFYLALSRLNQDGIIPNTGFIRNNARFNGEMRFGWFSVGLGAAYSQSKRENTTTSAGGYGMGGDGAMSNAYIWPRSEDMSHYKDENGNRVSFFGYETLQDEDFENPYWVADRVHVDEKNGHFIGNLNLKADIFDWFNIGLQAGLDRYNTEGTRNYEAGCAMKPLYQNGALDKSDYDYRHFNSRLSLNFQKQVADFDFRLSLNGSIERSKREYTWNWEYNRKADNPTTSLTNESRYKERQSSFAGEFQIDYRNMLYLHATGNKEWFSYQGIEDHYFTPSVGAAFVFTELLPKNKVLTLGKIRASWGKIGKKETTYWEKERTISKEIGLELEFFNSRLAADVTFYTQKSVNKILSTNAASILIDTATVKNRGWELTLTGRPIERKDFSWDAALSLWKNKGTVSQISSENWGGEHTAEYLSSGIRLTDINCVSVGTGAFSAFCGYTAKRDDQGRLVLNEYYLPCNSESAYYENREPKLQGSLRNALRWKNWTLSCQLDFRFGGAVYNGTEAMLTNYGLSKRTENRESITISGVLEEGRQYVPFTQTFYADKFYLYGNRGQEVSADTPGAISGRYIIQNYFSNLATDPANFITDTNWLRLRTLSLSYSVPQRWLKKAKFIKALKATATGTNLLLLTNYKNGDPEVALAGAYSVGSGSVGMDYYCIPSTAGFTFGLHMTL